MGHRYHHGYLALDEPRRASLLCRSVSIPDAFYQAAKIESAFTLGGIPLYPVAEDEPAVLLIAVLCASWKLHGYTNPSSSPAVRPGNSTTFLSIDLVKMGVGQFDLVPAAAMSNHLLPRSFSCLSSGTIYTVIPITIRSADMSVQERHTCTNEWADPSEKRQIDKALAPTHAQARRQSKIWSVVTPSDAVHHLFDLPIYGLSISVSRPTRRSSAHLLALAAEPP